MFKKRVVKHLRQKRDDSDEENTEDGESSQQSDDKTEIATTGLSKRSAPDVKNKAEKISSTASATSLLSFADDEGESTADVFQVRKSTQSRRLEKIRRKTKTNDEERTKSPLTFSSGNANKNKMEPSESSKSTSHKILIDGDNDSVVIIKQEDKRKMNESIILTGKDAEAADIAVEDTQDLKKRFSANEIPDAKWIHMARKQRQMARDSGDFIPVDDTQRYRNDAAVAKSRLIREDDDNDNSSGEEDGPGVEARRFYSKLHNDNDEERKKTEADFLNIEQGSDDEHDDELDKWEQEQIRKGVSVQQITSYRQEQLASAYYYSQSHSLYGVSGYDYDPNGQCSQFLPGQSGEGYYYDSSSYNQNSNAHPSLSEIKGPQPMDLDVELPQPLSHDDQNVPHTTNRLPKIGGGNIVRMAKQFDLSMLKARIKEKLDERDSVLRATSFDLEQKSQYIVENLASIVQLEKGQPELASKLELYQELRSYARDLLDCFDEKVPIIEKLEERALVMFCNRSSFLAKRRQQDVKDQFDELSMAALGKSMNNNDADRMMRSSEREARKVRRRQAREKTLAGLSHHDGMSSDDEEAPSRIANFASELEKISKEASEIWSDVDDDYCSVEKIIDRFSEWKKQDISAYNKCYADICLPKLLAPVVRSEMITWSVFNVDALSFDKLHWFTACSRFDKAQQGQENESKISSTNLKDDDVSSYSLSASVIEKVICPKLKVLVEQVWDPVSSSQCQQLSVFMKTTLGSIIGDKDNAKIKEVHDVIYKRIKSSLDEDLFTPIYSKEVVENKANGASSFLDRQFWLALKLLRNICLWENIMSTKVVEELSLDGVVNRHVVLNLQCSLATEVAILTKCKAVVSAVTSSNWFALLKKNDGINQLEPLCKIMYRICEQLHDSKTSNPNEAYDIQKEICKLLQKLRDSRYHKKLVDKFRIKL